MPITINPTWALVLDPLSQRLSELICRSKSSEWHSRPWHSAIRSRLCAVHLASPPSLRWSLLLSWHNASTRSCPPIVPLLYLLRESSTAQTPVLCLSWLSFPSLSPGCHSMPNVTRLSTNYRERLSPGTFLPVMLEIRNHTAVLLLFILSVVQSLHILCHHRHPSAILFSLKIQVPPFFRAH